MLLTSRGIWWYLLTYIWWWRGRTFWWVCKPMSLKNISARLGVTAHWWKFFLCKQKSVSLAKPYKYCFHLQYVNCLNGWNFQKCDFLVSSFLRLWWSKKFQFLSAVYIKLLLFIVTCYLFKQPYWKRHRPPWITNYNATSMIVKLLIQMILHSLGGFGGFGGRPQRRRRGEDLVHPLK